MIDQCRLFADVSGNDRAHERAGDDDQCHGRGELGNQEESAHAHAAADVAMRRRPIALQQRRHVDARRVQRRYQAEQQRRGDADRCGVEQHVRVEVDRQPRRLRQRQPDEVERPHCQQDAECAAGEGEQQAFRQQQSDQTEPAGTVCQADGDLLTAGGCAREQQVGDVRAADPQNQRDDHQRQDHDEQELDTLLRRHRTGPQLGADRPEQCAVRIHGGEARGQRPQLGVHPPDGTAWR